MINTNIFLNLPMNFEQKLKIYPITINQLLSEENFSLYKKILTTSQEDLEDEFHGKESLDENTAIPTPFEFLLSCCYNDETFDKRTKEAFKFFTKEDVTFLYEQKLILIGNLEEVLNEISSLDDLNTISEEEFFNFQNAIRISVGENPLEPPIEGEDPRVKRIKAKARYREKIKAKQGDGLEFGSMLASICCMGLGINPLNIGEMSYPAIKSIMSYYQEKEKYELDIRSLLAGGDSKKIKPEYWIRNLD